jgi:hypothetical protein
MRVVIFGYFGTLTDPGAEEYREPSRTAPASCSAAAGHGSVKRWPGASASAPGPVCLPPSVGLSASDSAGWQYGALPVVRLDLEPADVTAGRAETRCDQADAVGPLAEAGQS